MEVRVSLVSDLLRDEPTILSKNSGDFCGDEGAVTIDDEVERVGLKR